MKEYKINLSNGSENDLKKDIEKINRKIERVKT